MKAKRHSRCRELGRPLAIAQPMSRHWTMGLKASGLMSRHRRNIGQLSTVGLLMLRHRRNMETEVLA